MKLIDRYMAEVAHHLPASRRDEICRELRANLLDRLEAQGLDDQDETSLADLLQELGSPQRVAASYLPPRQLVAPELFAAYRKTLGLGLILVFMASVLSLGLSFIGTAHFPFVGFLGGFVEGALLMFAAVTGVFYLLSNSPAGRVVQERVCRWSPDRLPPVTWKWQRISYCHQASEVSFNLLLLMILHYPLLMSSEVAQQLFMGFSPDLSHWLPALASILGAALLLDMWNFRFNFWTKPKLALKILLDLTLGGLLLGLSHLPEKLVMVSKVESGLEFILPLVNHIVTMGLFFTGLWTLGRAAYFGFRWLRFDKP